MAFHEEEIFDGKTLGNLLKDIYKNQNRTKKQVTTLIAQLHPLIKNPSDATVLVPLIKEYLEIDVKNDDSLVKIAAIAQRAITAGTKPGEGSSGIGLTDEEKEELQALAEETEETETKLLEEPAKKEMGDIKDQVKQIGEGTEE